MITQAIIAREIDYLDDASFQHIEQESAAISGMLTRLIQTRCSTP